MQQETKTATIENSPTSSAHQEVMPNAIYTTEETKDLLRVSTSTIKRMLKKGLIRANKVGGQYRILGKEILRIVSPTMEKRAEKQYVMLKKKIIKVINKW